MKVWIDGIEYEGTPAEIRQIVENPPTRGRKAVNTGDGWEEEHPYPINPGPYVPPEYPSWPPTATPWYPHNWDGSPIVTCCAMFES